MLREPDAAAQYVSAHQTKLGCAVADLVHDTANCPAADCQVDENKKRRSGDFQEPRNRLRRDKYLALGVTGNSNAQYDGILWRACESSFDLLKTQGLGIFDLKLIPPWCQIGADVFRT